VNLVVLAGVRTIKFMTTAVSWKVRLSKKNYKTKLEPKAYIDRKVFSLKRRS